MTTQCFSMVRGRVMRATRLTGCGDIEDTISSAIVTKGFVSVGFTANVDEGETINVKNAAGENCINDIPDPVITGYTLTITFCEVNPELYAMLTGQAVVFDSSGNAVGFRVNSAVKSSSSGFALEVWSGVPGANCAGGTPTYGYVLVPFVQGGVLGDFTLENNAVTFTLQNATTKDGSLWGTGPYNVVNGAGGTPGKLATAISATDHLHVQLTTLAPPSPSCTATPSGPKSTSATAGTPGTYSPVDSYPPTNFTALATWPLTASPATNWTAGQYIVLDDDTKAHWNGTAWVAGIHP
jgi:hypothetical protein